MAKNLFKKYDYEFDGNEKKVLTSFCKQIIKQMEGDKRFNHDVNIFRSIISKLNSGEVSIRFTKDEKTRLKLQLKENIKQIETQIEKSWIIKKWLLKSMFNQYQTIFNLHFND